MIFSRFECRSRGNSQDPRSSASMRTLGNLDCGCATRCPYAPITRCSEHHALQSWRGWAPHRGIVPSPFKIPVSGESMRSDATSLWDGIPGARTAATEFRPSTGEGGGGDP